MTKELDPLSGIAAPRNQPRVPRYGAHPESFGERSPYEGTWEDSPEGRMERLRRELAPRYNLDDLPPDLAVGALEMYEERGRDHMLNALDNYYRHK